MPREGEKRPLLKHAIIAAIALVGMAVPTIAEAVEAEPTPDTSRLQVATLPAALARGLAADGPTVLELPMAVTPPWEL